MSESRNYPVVDPGDGDARFTTGLVLDVADTLQQWGYPELSSADYGRLLATLFAFVYRGGEY